VYYLDIYFAAALKDAEYGCFRTGATTAFAFYASCSEVRLVCFDLSLKRRLQIAKLGYPGSKEK